MNSVIEDFMEECGNLLEISLSNEGFRYPFDYGEDLTELEDHLMTLPYCEIDAVFTVSNELDFIISDNMEYVP